MSSQPPQQKKLFLQRLRASMITGLMLGAALFAAADLYSGYVNRKEFEALDPRFQIEAGWAGTDTAKCASNMRHVWLGLMAYAQDNDNRLPVGLHPINDLSPKYVHQRYLQCPKVAEEQQSYGLVSMCAGYKMHTAPYDILIPALVESDVEWMEPEDALKHLRFAHTEYVIGEIPDDPKKGVTIDLDAPPGTVYKVPVQEVPLVPYTKSLGTIIFGLDGHYSMTHPDFVAKYDMTDTDESRGTFSRTAIKRRLGQ